MPHADHISDFIVRILMKFAWHHISLIVDETSLSNSLIRRSLEGVFMHESSREDGYPIQLDIQSFTYRNYDGEVVNRSIDFGKMLQASSRVARSE